MCVYEASTRSVCVQIFLCVCVCVCLVAVDGRAATRQPPAATKKDATASGADVASYAAAATHPVC